MTKIQLIEKIASDTGIKKAKAEQVVDAFLAGMVSSLRETGRFVLAGAGVFKVRVRKARTARNPKTGEQVQVPERKTVGFKASRELKASVS